MTNHPKKMASSSPQLSSFSLWFLLFSSSSTLYIATSTDRCPLSFCGDSIFPIKFPFQITTNRPPTPPTTTTSTSSLSRCVYPGFELSCNRVNQTVLHLPDSGPFLVKNINYNTQSLWITDPKNCFPKRLLRGLNLNQSPFVTDRLTSFTFVNCSSDVSSATDYENYRAVSCLSGKNYTVLAWPSVFYNASQLPSSCVRVSTVKIPMPWGLWSSLEVGIGLVWRQPSCGYCEEQGLACGFKNNTSLESRCSKLTSSSVSKKTNYGIVLGIGIPALCCMIGFGCYLCSRIRAAGQRPHLINTEAVTWPLQVITETGLDGPTIESYPKTLLGESKRLPKPNDNTCSICLCEYQAKETLRTIPECNHYFHADCIDEWLKMKASCPVCRNSPDSSTFGTPSTSTSSTSSSSS